MRVARSSKRLGSQSDWFTFQPSDDSATVHASKLLAVRDAQYRGNTTVRPKKLRAGHYELRGCNGRQYWIISQPLMKDNFLQLMQIAYEETA